MCIVLRILTHVWIHVISTPIRMQDRSLYHLKKTSKSAKVYKCKDNIERSHFR